MLGGAFAAAVGSGPHGFGVGRRWLFAMLAGMAVAWVQANMSHRLPADQFVVGLVLNVLVLGLVGFLAERDRTAVSNIVGRVRRSPCSPRSRCSARRCSTSRGCCTSCTRWCRAIWWLVYRTRWGLEVRAIGEDPNAADVSGLHVNKLRRQTIYLAGLTAGLAGSATSCSPGPGRSRTR